MLFRELASQISPNFEIICAYDGQEAIEYLETANSDPAVIFLDINMPRMNGHEFIEAYGQTISQRDIPVYVLTSSIYEKDRVMFSPYNCVTDFCLKAATYDNIAAILIPLTESYDLANGLSDRYRSVK